MKTRMYSEPTTWRKVGTLGKLRRAFAELCTTSLGRRSAHDICDTDVTDHTHARDREVPIPSPFHEVSAVEKSRCLVARLHTDFGRALMRVARRSASGHNSESHCSRNDSSTESVPSHIEELRESCAALRLGSILGDDRAAEISKKCEDRLLELRCDAGAGLGSEEVWGQVQTDAALLQRSRSGREPGAPDALGVASAAKELCGGSGGATVNVSVEEVGSGRLKLQTMLSIFTRLDVCGVVELSGPIVSSALLEDVGRAQREAFEDASKAASDGSFAVQRWERRFEIQVPLKPPYINPELIACPLILEIVRLLLGPRVEIDTFSHVTAEGGAPDQPWHPDVDLLFKEPGALNLGHHPPVGLVAIVPLVDIVEILGPTEFVLGSHIHVGYGFWDEGTPSDNGSQQNSVLNASGSSSIHKLQPLPHLGSVVLFDLRTRHRGRRNQAEVPRTVLYMSYVKDWFLDRLNFRGHQSSAFDGLQGRRMQKLLRRVDARTYVADLEAFVAGQVTDAPQRAKPFREPELSI